MRLKAQRGGADLELMTAHFAMLESQEWIESQVALLSCAPQAVIDALEAIDLRDELEHIDQPKVSRLFVPIRSTAGALIFLLPSGPIDLHELFNDTEKLCRAIAEAIRSYELAASAP